jgi:hypothetical protein
LDLDSGQLASTINWEAVATGLVKIPGKGS